MYQVHQTPVSSVKIEIKSSHACNGFTILPPLLDAPMPSPMTPPHLRVRAGSCIGVCCTGMCYCARGAWSVSRLS